MTAGVLIKLLSALLLANSAMHLVIAALDSPADLRLPLIAFGLLYGGLGLWVRSEKRLAVLVTILVTALGVTLGGMRYLQEGGPLALPVMFLIDVGVLAAGGWWMLKSKAAT
jgi:hypothetical protein